MGGSLVEKKNGEEQEEKRRIVTMMCNVKYKDGVRDVIDMTIMVRLEDGTNRQMSCECEPAMSCSDLAEELVFYGLICKVTWRGSNLARPFLQFCLFLMAFGTALSRVTDNKHHPTDVIAGMMVGGAISFVAHNFLYRSLRPVIPVNQTKLPEEEKMKRVVAAGKPLEANSATTGETSLTYGSRSLEETAGSIEVMLNLAPLRYYWFFSSSVATDGCRTPLPSASFGIEESAVGSCGINPQSVLGVLSKDFSSA
ncbi:unnamed protein product, partial [Cyprideis torosa]